MPREIETLSGEPYEPGLSASRWTSTSGRWDVRAPFAARSGRGGVRGLGCGCRMEGLRGAAGGCGCQKKSLAGLAADEVRKLDPLFVAGTYEGSFLGARGFAAPAGKDQILQAGFFFTGTLPDLAVAENKAREAFASAGFTGFRRIKEIQYPLKWGFLTEKGAVLPVSSAGTPVGTLTGPDFIRAYVTNEDAGPFKLALAKERAVLPFARGPITTLKVTGLPKVGTAVWFEGRSSKPLTPQGVRDIRLPFEAAVDEAAGAYRNAIPVDKFKASGAEWSTYLDGGEATFAFTLSAADRPSGWGLGLALAAAGALLLMRKKDQDLIEQGFYP